MNCQECGHPLDPTDATVQPYSDEEIEITLPCMACDNQHYTFVDLNTFTSS